MYIVKELREQLNIELALNLTKDDNITWAEAFKYTDIVISKKFEMLPMRRVWTDEDMLLAATVQKDGLYLPFTSAARKLFISKLLAPPMLDMKGFGQNQTTGIPLYRHHSAHDTQIANILTQIIPSYNYSAVPYASSIIFEFYEQEDDFTIRTLFNGQALELPGCEGKDCSYKKFFDYMNGRLFIDQDLWPMCDKQPTEDDTWNSPIIDKVIFDQLFMKE